MPNGFALVPWEDNVAFWAANDLRRIPEARWMIAVGRLKPGVTLAAAQAEATAVTRQVLESRGEKAGVNGALVVSLQEAFFGDATTGLTFLLGAVSFVLLIACANVATCCRARHGLRRKIARAPPPAPRPFDNGPTESLWRWSAAASAWRWLSGASACSADRAGAVPELLPASTSTPVLTSRSPCRCVGVVLA